MFVCIILGTLFYENIIGLSSLGGAREDTAAEWDDDMQDAHHEAQPDISSQTVRLDMLTTCLINSGTYIYSIYTKSNEGEIHLRNLERSPGHLCGEHFTTLWKGLWT